MARDETVLDDDEQDRVARWQTTQPDLRLSDNIASKTWRACDLYGDYFVNGWVLHPPYPSWWLWADYLAYAIARALGVADGVASVPAIGGPHAG